MLAYWLINHILIGHSVLIHFTKIVFMHIHKYVERQIQNFYIDTKEIHILDKHSVFISLSNLVVEKEK